MVAQPPNEGARWGKDPAPNPVQTEPQIRSAYTELCEEYGEANVKKALSIREKTISDYPQLAIFKDDPMTVASSLLKSALKQVEKASEDGRPHTMPETLDIISNHIGKLAATNKNTKLSDVTVTYGDESQGKAHKQKILGRIGTWIFFGVLLLIGISKMGK